VSPAELEEFEDCLRKIWILWIVLLCMAFGLVQGLIVALEIARALMNTDDR
jgi:sensor histidine kinase regulating citrate/malate metabolism